MRFRWLFFPLFSSGFFPFSFFLMGNDAVQLRLASNLRSSFSASPVLKSVMCSNASKNFDFFLLLFLSGWAVWDRVFVAQADLKVTMYWRLPLNSSTSCLPLPSAPITGPCYRMQPKDGFLSKHSPTELHPKSYGKNNKDTYRLKKKMCAHILVYGYSVCAIPQNQPARARDELIQQQSLSLEPGLGSVTCTVYACSHACSHTPLRISKSFTSVDNSSNLLKLFVLLIHNLNSPAVELRAFKGTRHLRHYLWTGTALQTVSK